MELPSLQMLPGTRGNGELEVFMKSCPRARNDHPAVSLSGDSESTARIEPEMAREVI